MNVKDKKIVIIGGGVSGTSAAAFAIQSGFSSVTLIESTNTLGGFHKDVEIDGLHYDLGAFFFWPSHNLLNLFPELREIFVNAESSKHLSLTNGFEIDAYPPTLSKYAEENGWLRTIFDGIQLFLGRLWRAGQKHKNVEDVLSYYMGPFYKKMGLKNYVKRLYSLDPTLVNIEFSNKRLGPVIEKFKLKNLLKTFFSFKWTDLNRYEIVADTWARPESGFAVMYKQIEENLKKSGCNLILGEIITKVNRQEKKIETSTGNIIAYDYLLSSMPLKNFGDICNEPFNGILKHKELYSLFYEAPIDVVEDCYVLFNFSEKGVWKRITFHSNYYNVAKNSITDKVRHYFVVESMPEGDMIESKNILELLDTDLKNTFTNTRWADKFSKAKLIGHHFTKNAYPIFDLEFDRSKVIEFKTKLEQDNIFLVGRQGEFEYLSSDDASRSAVNAIKKLLI